MAYYTCATVGCSERAKGETALPGNCPVCQNALAGWHSSTRLPVADLAKLAEGRISILESEFPVMLFRLDEFRMVSNAEVFAAPDDPRFASVHATSFRFNSVDDFIKDYDGRKLLVYQWWRIGPIEKEMIIVRLREWLEPDPS